MRRWTASYEFRYRPVISWERRRNTLLDWVEDHLQPVAFRDDRNEVGISLQRGVRIRISRARTVLEDTEAESGSFESLWPMFDAVLEALEPRQVTLGQAAIAWSSEVVGDSYSAATRSLAERVSGANRPTPSGIIPTDVAALVDFMSEKLHVQVEYGIVNPAELRVRVNNPEASKINERPQGAVPQSAFDDLPKLLLFLDTKVHSRHPEVLDDRPGIQRAFDEFRTASAEVAEAVAAGALTEKENAK